MKIQIGVVRLLLAVCVLLQLSFFVLAWSSLLPAGGFIQVGAPEMSIEAMRVLALPQRLAGAALAVPALLSMCYGMWRLERMLANLERRAMFDHATIGHLRAFAGATLFSTVMGIGEHPLRSVLFRFGFDARDTSYSVGINSEQLLLILVCALFYVVITMMHEGRRLAEENEGFV